MRLSWEPMCRGNQAVAGAAASLGLNIRYVCTCLSPVVKQTGALLMKRLGLVDCCWSVYDRTFRALVRRSMPPSTLHNGMRQGCWPKGSPLHPQTLRQAHLDVQEVPVTQAQTRYRRRAVGDAARRRRVCAQALPVAAVSTHPELGHDALHRVGACCFHPLHSPVRHANPQRKRCCWAAGGGGGSGLSRNQARDTGRQEQGQRGERAASYSRVVFSSGCSSAWQRWALLGAWRWRRATVVGQPPSPLRRLPLISWSCHSRLPPPA